MGKLNSIAVTKQNKIRELIYFANSFDKSNCFNKCDLH